MFFFYCHHSECIKGNDALIVRKNWNKNTLRIIGLSEFTVDVCKMKTLFAKQRHQHFAKVEKFEVRSKPMSIAWRIFDHLVDWIIVECNWYFRQSSAAIQRNKMKRNGFDLWLTCVLVSLYCRRLAFIKRTHNGQIKSPEMVWHIETNWYLVCMWDDIPR